MSVQVSYQAEAGWMSIPQQSGMGTGTPISPGTWSLDWDRIAADEIGVPVPEWHMLKQKTNMKKQKLDEIGDWLEFRSSLA